jgi:iron(III) transport system permease protein
MTIQAAGLPRPRTLHLAGLPRLTPLGVLALLPMALLLLFVVVLLWVSFQTGTIGTASAVYSSSNYAQLLTDPFVLTVLWNTAQFALTATCFALAIGLPVAWLTERTTLPGKALVYAIMTLGLLIPGIYTAMGWTFVAHPRIGFVNTWLRSVFGPDAPILDVTTPLGMAFVQGMSQAPLAFILTVQTFAAMNPSLEEAAKAHGMSLLRTMRRVTLPLAWPGILAALIYILILALATFDIPAILGLGNRVYMLSTYIYLKTHPQGAAAPEHGVTAALGVVMIAVALLLTVWYSQVLRHGHRYQVITGKGYRPTPLRLGRWTLVAWLGIAVYALLSKLMPLAMLAFAAFTPYLVAPTPDNLRLLSLANYRQIDLGLVLRGLTNTAILVGVVPLAVIFFAWCLSWVIVRSRSRLRYALEFGAFLPHALPDVILAVSALLLGLFVLGKVIPIYGSVWLIALVYLLARMAFATRTFNAALLQIHRELEEAAFVAGLSTFKTAWRILLPIVRPAVLSVWIWSALLIYRELTVAAFLVSQENITLPAVVWSFWMAGGRNMAAAVTLVMIGMLAPLIVLFWWLGRRSQVATP